MRFVWKILSQPKMAEEPLYGVVSEKAEKETLEKQRKNLADYLKGIEGTKEVDRVKFRNQAREWENNNNRASLRKAGKSMEEDEKDPLIRNRLLSSSYIEEIKGRENLTFRVDFKNNMLAEKILIGAGDIFPSNVSIIAVNGRRAVRAINPSKERIGYYDEKEFAEGRYVYVPVFTGDMVEILETRESTDYLVQRRQMQERITLYRGRGATAVEDAELTPVEKRNLKKGQITGAIRGQLGAFGREVVRQESNDPAEVLESRRRLVEVAKKYAGTRYFQENYFDVGRQFSADVQGGRLGCALVVSSILREAGFMDDLKTPILGVELTETELQKRGWTRTNGPIEAGDVLVWAPAGAPVTDENGQVRARHGHIGIAISPTRCVHNSNNYEEDPSTGKKKFVFKGPVEQNITRTPVAIWKPPGARPATTEMAAAPARTANAAGRTVDRQPSVASRAGGETIPTSREKPDTKLSRAIENATNQWLPLIQASCEKYGITNFVPLVRALMFMESGGNPNAVGKNSNGTFDQGLMQLNSAYFKHPNIMDPAVNIDVAVRNLKDKVAKYGGNLIDIITAYNCGHAEGEKIGGKVLGAPANTKNIYVPHVLQNLASLGYTDVPEHGNYSDTRYA